MVDVYAWNKGHGLSNVMDPPSIAPQTGNATTDADAASTILDAMPEGKRAVTFKAGGISEVVSDMYDVADSTPAAMVSMITNQPDDAGAITYFDAFFARIASNGSTIDRLILDLEINDMDTFSLNTASGGDSEFETNMQAVKDDATAWAKVPVWLQDSIVISDFAPHNGNLATQRLWNQWSQWQKASAFRRILLESAESALSRSIRASDYLSFAGAHIRPFTNDGWDFGSQMVRSTVSENAYLYNFAGGTWVSGATLEGRWNNFIRTLNNARAVIASGMECVPWIGFPNYNGGTASDPDSYLEPTYLWEEQIKHYYAMGVRTFLWFNRVSEGDPETMNPLASQAFDDLENINPNAATDLSPIPIDSLTVTTGPISTPYDSDLVT